MWQNFFERVWLSKRVKKSHLSLVAQLSKESVEESECCVGIESEKPLKLVSTSQLSFLLYIVTQKQHSINNP